MVQWLNSAKDVPAACYIGPTCTCTVVKYIPEVMVLRCLCPKTVELFTVVTSGSNTHTDIIL